MPHNLDTLTNEELIHAYGDLIQLMNKRGIIRTKNIVGDLGETMVIEHYNNTPGLPRLERSPTNNPDADAVSEGVRYSIKATTGNRTSAFHLDAAVDQTSTPSFEHLIVVMFTDNCQVKRIQQYSWEEFLRLKRWSEPQKAWFISLSRDVLASGKMIYSSRS